MIGTTKLGEYTGDISPYVVTSKMSSSRNSQRSPLRVYNKVAAGTTDNKADTHNKQQAKHFTTATSTRWMFTFLH